MWLADLLPQTIPNVRVTSYAWPADILSLRDVAVVSTTDIATRLLH